MDSRRKLARRRVQFRQVLGRHRVLPDFLILGAQRCGTSSLYRYLGAHPDLIASVRKETAYFSTRFDQGESWYRAHFALRSRVAIQRIVRTQRPLSFEATPDYLFHPLVPARVKRMLPNARFITLLRDPVERAFSHYRHMRRLRFEDLSFEQAIAEEEARISPDIEQLSVDPYHRARQALRFSYIARGRYADQLERWLESFPHERFLILDSQELFEQPTATVREICSFLEVESWSPRIFRNYSWKQEPESEAAEAQSVIPKHLRDSLRQQFSEDHERLARLTGREFSWI